MEMRDDWQEQIYLVLFLLVSDWYYLWIWRHCFAQKFPVVDQELEDFGFHLNLMIGLGDSLLTIVDGYFVALLIKAIFLFCCFIFVVGCIELSLYSCIHIAKNTNITEPTAHSCSTKYSCKLANEFKGGVEWEIPTSPPQKTFTLHYMRNSVCFT